MTQNILAQLNERANMFRFESLVDIWNEFCDYENRGGERIYTNDEENIRLFFTDPWEAVRATFFGNWKCGDDWICFNQARNLESAWNPCRWMDFDELAEFLNNNPKVASWHNIDIEDEEE